MPGDGEAALSYELGDGEVALPYPLGAPGTDALPEIRPGGGGEGGGAEPKLPGGLP